MPIAELYGSWTEQKLKLNKTKNAHGLKTFNKQSNGIETI